MPVLQEQKTGLMSSCINEYKSLFSTFFAFSNNKSDSPLFFTHPINTDEYRVIRYY